jgi:dihydroneopterin aldolase
MSDKIIVNRLAVRNITGVDNWERVKRQPIYVTVTVYTDIREVYFEDSFRAYLLGWQER